ncbi:MAG: prepilin peptidase [Planctomycetota bacterium]|nr:prepilin peptidase [Planctomycetota bacterium]
MPCDFSCLLAQTVPLWKLYQHLPVAVFVFVFGAIVGSFINVVIYRLPAGMSVISPPSRCPTCGARLSWRENLPILGWFLVRGRCTHCQAKVSPQYMIIELIMAMIFLGLYAAYYMAGPRVAWWGSVGGDWWYYNWVFRTSPAFIAHAFLLAALVAMTVIDARTFTIPIQIPLAVTVMAVVAYSLQALLGSVPRAMGLWPIPAADWQWFAVACGGMLGIGVSMLLLKLGVLRYSFADYDEHLKDGETLADYPHARREMGVELVFLLPCIIGLLAGFFVGARFPAEPPPVVLQALGGSIMGYLTGAGILWAVRILGTLAFGREAMGLGDPHLLGAVGATLGWVDPIFVFLLAPFFGLAWAFVSMGFGSVFKGARRALPFGPHLAVATLVVLMSRPAINWVQARYTPWWPQPRLVPSAPAISPGTPQLTPKPVGDSADKVLVGPVGLDSGAVLE